MTYARCLLCEQLADLCQSHAMPDALFRPLLRRGGGSAIRVVDDASTPVQLDSDSWKTPQLCAPCEALMNDEWDGYGIAVFQGRRGNARPSEDGVSIEDVDAVRLRMFLLSVLWRMAVSVHPSYLNAHLPTAIREKLRRAFLARQPYTAGTLHVTLQRLHDSTQGGFSRDQFKEMVMAPFLRRHPACYLVGFCMFGFVVQVYVPGLPPKPRRTLHLVGSSATIVFAPRLEFTAFPELFGLAVTTLGKQVTGLTKVKGP